MRFNVEVTIRRGFPLRVTGEVCPAEPENGLPSSYMSDVDITTLRGGSVKFLRLTPDELVRIEEDAWYQIQRKEY